MKLGGNSMVVIKQKLERREWMTVLIQTYYMHVLKSQAIKNINPYFKNYF